VHGICVTREFAEVEYKCTYFYDPADELRIIWNDPAIGIDWPVKAPLLSDKDRIARTFAEQIDLMPVWREELA
jgi:dTDP-4-dehydrorhamnose 3,5-epimerase